MVLGPQDALFPKESIETLLRETYTVTPSSDRMGTRLEGPAIQAREKSDIISDGIAAGSIQIPASACPSSARRPSDDRRLCENRDGDPVDLAKFRRYAPVLLLHRGFRIQSTAYLQRQR